MQEPINFPVKNSFGYFHFPNNPKKILFVQVFATIVYLSIALIIIYLYRDHLQSPSSLQPSFEHVLLKQVWRSEDQLSNSNFYRYIDEYNSGTVPTSTKMLWKEETLLDSRNFRWEMNNTTQCYQSGDSSTKKRLIPVLIHSARENFLEREIIRKTWISVQDTYENWDVRPVFLLGRPELVSQSVMMMISSNRADIMERITTEQQQFGDMVMGNFVDSYKHICYKHLMGYKWILNFCQNAFFVLKTDDDMFIDIFDWLDRIKEDFNKVEKNSSIHAPDLYCMTFASTKPVRDPKSKYYVSWSDWPEEYYPDYCSGNAYGISMDAIRKLYSLTKVQKFTWMDDAYVTGILRRKAQKKLNWQPVIKDVWANVSGKLEEWMPFCKETNTGTSEYWNRKRPFKTIVHVPRVDFKEAMTCLWKKVLHDRKMSEVEKLKMGFK